MYPPTIGAETVLSQWIVSLDRQIPELELYSELAIRAPEEVTVLISFHETKWIGHRLHRACNVVAPKYRGRQACLVPR